MSASNHSSALTVIYAKDMQCLARFYQALLGLKRTEEDKSFVALGANSLELVIVQAPPYIADSIEISRPPLVRENTPIKVSFGVVSIEALRGTVGELGGALKPAEAGWSWRGSWHLDGHDPEGNVFQLRQSAA